jgi:cytidylate kinase
MRRRQVFRLTKEQTMTEPASIKSAERQMRQWAIGIEVKERVEHEHAVHQLPHHVHPYIAFSRDTGAGASEVARRVGESLGWEVLNKELLDAMAQKFDLKKAMLQAVDETTTSWMLEVFGKWISSQVVTQTEYVTRLGEILLMATRHQSMVFVGRGAQFFLPRERGLAVQIVAPTARRIHHVAQREKLSQDAAKKYLKKRDRERRDFVREHFDRDVTDPHLYDLVVNLESLDLDWVVDLIVRTCQHRFELS